MSENRTGKYLKYALGEILLVMVGILLALQVNNWNEERKDKESEKVILNGLKEDFQENLKRVNWQLNRNSGNLENAIQLINHIGPNEPTISDSILSALTVGALQAEVQFRPSDGHINEVFISGKLEVLQNENLRAMLSRWRGMLQMVKYQEEQEHGRIRYKLIEFLEDEANHRRLVVNNLGDGFGFGQTKFPRENLHLLNSEKLESYLVSFIGTGQYLNTGYYKTLKNYIENILGVINQELENNR